MKEGVRIAAFACGPIRKGRAKSLIVGVVYRKGIVEGILSGTVEEDGTDSTRKMIAILTHSRFRDQVRIIALNGVALAGLNIVDVNALSKATKTEIILITKRRQNHVELIKALKSHQARTTEHTSERIGLVKEQAKLKQIKIKNLFVRSTMTESETRPHAEESYAAIRLAHMIASGISTGESKTRI
jgi:endonuclease V-like protein UPF0215 family